MDNKLIVTAAPHITGADSKIGRASCRERVFDIV